MSNNKIVLSPSSDTSYVSIIQEAIDKLALTNGGEITLSPGVYLSKPIKLISNLKMIFEHGVIIKFSDNFADYESQHTRWEGTECTALRSMLFAENCSNIELVGPAIFDGQGRKWWNAYRELRKGNISDEVKAVQSRIKPFNENLVYGSGGGGIETNFLRPSLVQFKDCQNVTVDGTTHKDPAFWNTHIVYCKDVNLQNIYFISPGDSPNTDGLDIDSSTYVNVTKCNFNVGDDCLCLKSGIDEDGQRVNKSTNNVTISECSMNKGHGGIVFGSETSGGLHDITIDNCQMSGTDRGIRIKTRRGRGGAVRNLTLSNLKMEGVICPIVVNMYYRCGATPERTPALSSLEAAPFDAVSTPVIENITIKNIQAYNIKSTPAYFYGIPESTIKNLSIESFVATIDKSQPLLPPAMDFFDSVPEDTNFMMKNIEGLELKNIIIDGEVKC